MIDRRFTASRAITKPNNNKKCRGGDVCGVVECYTRRPRLVVLALFLDSAAPFCERCRNPWNVHEGLRSGKDPKVFEDMNVHSNGESENT